MRVLSLTLLAAIGCLSSTSFGSSVPADDCARLIQPEVNEVVGNAADFPFDGASVTITSQLVSEVGFSVSQTWMRQGLPMVAVSYRSLDGHDQCSLESVEDGATIPFGASKEILAQCSYGYADVGVYIYVGPQDEFDVNECESCTVPNDKYVGYYLTIPCVPSCESVRPDCISAPTVHLADVGACKTCFYHENPIKANATDMKTDSVKFTISNSWPQDIDALSVFFNQYKRRSRM